MNDFTGPVTYQGDISGGSMVQFYSSHFRVEIPNNYSDGVDSRSGQPDTPAPGVERSLREEDLASYRFCCPPSCGPTHPLSQVSSVPYSECSYPPSSSYEYPEFQIINKNAPLTWGPEYEISSTEVCDVVASMNSDGAEDKQIRDAHQLDLGQSSDYTLRILLPPESQTGEQSTTQTPTMHQGGEPIIQPLVYTSDHTHAAAQEAGVDPPVSSSQTFLPSVHHLSTPGHAPPGFTFNSVPAQFLSQFHPALCPVRPGTEVQQHLSSVGVSWEKSKKPCNCTKSQCLKLYCDCFANGDVCSNCNCVNCCNNAKHQAERCKAIRVCLNRNKEAFRPKIDNRTSGEVKGRHSKGCNCKRSGCLKNYCECYEAKIMCSSTCKCVGCRNYSRSPVKGKLVWNSPHSTYCTSHKPRSLVLCITPAVVEATCGCLLAQAEEAEKKRCSSPHAERMILEEYGQCLSEIISSIFRDSHVL